MVGSVENSSDLALVADLVWWHLAARDHVRLQLVSKEWQAWRPENAKVLAKVRKDNQLRDWYFPTGLDSTTLNAIGLNCTPTWWGVHHPSQKEDMLPALDFLRPHWPAPSEYTLLDSECGLVLLFADAYFHNYGRVSLIVCNPLTKKYRELPADKCIYDDYLRYRDHQASFHIVVNDETSSYEVIVLISTNLIAICSSQSNRWSYAYYEHPVRERSQAKEIFGSICSKGCIYVLMNIYRWNVIVWVYLIEARRWLPDIYTLYDPDTYCQIFSGSHRIMRGPSLVACMGDIYAIVPEVIEELSPDHAIAENRRVLQWSERRDSEDLPATVTFHVFKLQEKNSTFAFCTTLECSVPLKSCSLVYHEYPRKWYRVVAKANVLWLACMGKLLGFDVVSGRCVSPQMEFELTPFEDFSSTFGVYEPNFHVDP